MERVSGAAACAALGLLLVAGCSNGGPANTATANSATASGAPAAAPVSGPDTAITAADLPHLRAGYWERVGSTNGAPPETEHFCSSGKPFSPPKSAGRGCSTFTFKRTFAGGIVIDADCAEGPVTSKLHMTVSGDFNSSYTTDGQASIMMQGKPASSFTTHVVTRYVGACPAGVTPQDE